MKKYHQNKPPSYNLAQVSVPTFIFYGEIDTLVNIEDILYLKSVLPNATATFLKNYGHVDFVLYRKARNEVYLPILANMAKFKINRV